MIAVRDTIVYPRKEASHGWFLALMILGASPRHRWRMKKSTCGRARRRTAGLMLFDGESTFGWQIEGEAAVKEGELVLGGAKETTARLTEFGDAQLRLSIDRARRAARASYRGSQVMLLAPSEMGSIVEEWTASGGN
jgi:hypothetical protein